MSQLPFELPLDQPLPWKGVLRDREYAGEILCARSWHPELAQLPADRYFRIVFLSRGGALPPEAVDDPRLVFFVPAELPGRVREERVEYCPLPLPGVESPYSAGTMLSRFPLPLTPAQVFSPGWRYGLEQVSSALLASWEVWQWNQYLAYLSCFAPQLSQAHSPEEVAAQEGRLREELERLRRLLPSLRSAWEQLQAAGEGGEARKALDRLSPLTVLPLLELCHYLASHFPSPESLVRDLTRCRHLEELLPAVSGIVAARRYVEAASPQEAELSLDRVSLLEQLSPTNLIENPHLWESLHTLFTWFRGRYRTEYADFHRRYYRELTRLRQGLERAALRVDALNRLNSIPELGEAVGVGLAAEYQGLLARVAPCLGAEQEIPEPAPLCPQCRLIPPVSPPTEEVSAFLHRLEQALAEQQRRLSSQAVRQILESSGEKRLERFLKVLRAGDPSPLVNILNDEVVDFLRRLLAEGATAVVKVEALQELKRRFPEVEEGEVDALLADLRRRLHRSFRQAEREHPGRRIRLSWEE